MATFQRERPSHSRTDVTLTAVKGKLKCCACAHREGIRDSEGRDPLILNLNTRGRWSDSRPGWFTLGKDPSKTKRTGRLKRTRSFGEQNTLLPLLGIEPRLRSSLNKVINHHKNISDNNEIGKGWHSLGDSNPLSLLKRLGI
jgi:hypothetical protein